MSREIVREHGVMLLLGTMRAEERLAAFLLNLVQRLQARGFSRSELVLRMTRQEIGSYLGLKLETVSRTFSRFAEEGMIEVHQRQVRILDVERLRGLLAQPDVGFVLVSSASPRSVDEALFFHERLQAESMPIAGLVANRVTPDVWPQALGAVLPDASDVEGALVARGVRDDAAARLAASMAQTLAEHQVLARADAREVERLFRAATAARTVVPRLESDVHDLAGLARLAADL
jgi:anion-transporting  ArsA/GET3 family ATPase